jgi:hypothetical protein
MKAARCRCAGIVSLAVITACSSDSIASAPQLSRIELRHASRVAVVYEQISIQALAFDAKGARIRTPELSWTSDDPTIATVDPNGRVTGQGIGTVTIRASASDVEGSIWLTVGAWLSIGPQSGSNSLVIGETVVLEAQFRGVGSQPVPAHGAFTWSTPDTHLVSLKPALGLDRQHVEVRGIATGLASISVVSEDSQATHIVGVVPEPEPANPPIRVRYFSFFVNGEFVEFLPGMEVTVETSRSVELLRVDVAVPGGRYPPLCSTARLTAGQHTPLGESSYSSKGFPPISFFPVPQEGVALLTYRTDHGELGWTVARGSLDQWGYGGGPLSTVPWNACGS